jgi:hypothetical protein
VIDIETAGCELATRNSTFSSGDLSGCNGKGCGVVIGSPTSLAARMALLWFRNAHSNFCSTAPGGNLKCASMRHGYGVVFRVDKTGKYKALYFFTGGNDRAGPGGDLVDVR